MSKKNIIGIIVTVSAAFALLCVMSGCKNQGIEENQVEEEIAFEPENLPQVWWNAQERIMWQRDLKKKLTSDIRWGLKTRKADLSKMIFIPAGEATVGDARVSGDGEAGLVKRKVQVGAFYIDVTEITNADYSRCVKERMCLPGCIMGHIPGWNEPDRPAILNYKEAERYCFWLGKRLPTEYEWEKAARGDKGFLYPWGNEAPVPGNSNICGDKCVMDWADGEWEDGYPFTSPVGSFPQSDSPYRVKDMSGNLKEWVQSHAPLPPDTYVVRGGSWYSSRNELVTSYRQVWRTPIRLDDKGARCAADAKRR